MTMLLRSKGWAISLGLTLLLALALVAAACGGEDEEEDEIRDIQRSPETPIVVPPDRPIMIGVSVPLTGPDEVVGIEDLGGVIVGMGRWKDENGNTIGGHEIEIRAEDDGCSEPDITEQAAERLLGREGLVGVI
ncbi:MAG: hypothetical protein AMJ76_03590, partial [Dehalococcoidia bacterium SM23_28_1]